MREKIIDTIAYVCQELYQVEAIIELERPDEQFGDYSSNVAMRLANSLSQNPRDIAQSIASKLAENELFSSVGVAGPGFINMTVSDSELIHVLNQEDSQPLKNMKILVEYSDPNPFKPLHAGHLYTTIVGDAISRIIERVGAQTIRLNYGGDVGLHVAKSMWAIVNWFGGELPEKLQEINIDEIANWMGERYVEGNNAYIDDDLARSEIIEMNKKIYEIQLSGDKDSTLAQIYWSLRSESYSFFTSLYKQLDVHEFDRFIPESEVTELGLTTVREQTETGVFQESNGAIIFDGEKFGLHKRVFINSAGLPTYETKDVGNSLTKWNDYKFDESIIITDNSQIQYMEVVVKAIEQFAPEPALRTKHITHGILKLQGGVKMSSRKGTILLAQDIIDAARKAGEDSGNAKHENIILAAIKYALLKNRIGGDIIYNPDESIAMEGNSGPYLQYSHARARSILKKAQNSGNLATDSFDKFERPLILKLTLYIDVIEQAALEFAPHLVCSYLYDLAQTFNRFYENSTVIGSDREDIRLALVEVYANTLQKGLSLLGITAPDSM